MTLAACKALLQEADLYVVITERFCAGRSSLETLRACLDVGVRIVQLREKDMADRELLALARDWRAETRKAGALFILDDRVDIALASGADGVHLGQSDLPLDAARCLGPELLLGASTHSLADALASQASGADYVNIGPVFATQTKETAVGAVGPELIAAVRPHLYIPFSCMGGIKDHNLDEVLAQGARMIAVVTAVTAAPDPRVAAEGLRARILTGRA